MSGETERVKKGAYRKGQTVTPEPASDQSTMKNVFGFLQDYVPQAVSGPKEDKKERVLWARFETCDINDSRLSNHSAKGGRLPLVLCLGLANGFAVWLINPGGDAKELYSVCGDGETARIARLLPSPDEAGAPDKHSDSRPIMAVVKKGRHINSSTVGYSTLQLLSLRTQGDNIVKKFVFKTRAIVDVECGKRVVATVFQKRIVILDAGSLENRYVIKNNYPSIGYPCNPVALATRWLAFSETKLSSKHQSVGGVSNATPPSVATTVLKNVKKGISALTETISGLAGKQVQTQESPEQTVLSQSADSTSANIITVLDIGAEHKGEFKVHELSRENDGVVAHFVAHTGPNIHIAALAFNPSGTLLVSASTEGNSFHVFHVLPHPWLSSDSAVHHIYTLYRGATAGIVQDVCFSGDSRWVGVSTLNGTTHVFPVSPYGGEINVRTHTPRRVVNRMSRFHTSAGIRTSAQSHSGPKPPRSSQSPPGESRESPLLTAYNDGGNWNNPRGLPLPCPIVANALQQIKQPYVSTQESAATSGNTTIHQSRTPETNDHVTLPGPDTVCVRACFLEESNGQGSSWSRAEAANDQAVYSLFVMGPSGDLVEHSLEPHKLPTAPDGDDAPIELSRSPKLAWKLLGFPTTTGNSMPPTLAESSPLLQANNQYKQLLLKNDPNSSTTDQWLSQVEILTHAPPTRRLWMGPQFSFKSYHSPDSHSDSNVLKTPSPPNTVIYTGSLSSPNQCSLEGNGATLQPSSDNILANLMIDSSDLTSLRLQSFDTSPVAMPTGNEDKDTGCVEVLGSWSKVAPCLESRTYEVEQQLQEAMSEGQVTILAGQSLPRTGFSPPKRDL